MNNAELIHQFYQSFANGDAEGMVACYHPDIEFEDPAFGKLKGEDAKNMWRMLIGRNKGGINITFNNIEANGDRGSAHWEAIYVFSQTGRKVHNKINAQFEFKDGKIIQHTDHFDLWKWTQMAMGWKGYLLGWTGFMRGKIQAQTRGLLAKYNPTSNPR